MNAQLSLTEYSTLTVLRVAVKMLKRVCAVSDSFRSPHIRRLVLSAENVLAECVTEIEGYDPGLIERERRTEEEADRKGGRPPDTLPDIEQAATSDTSRARQLHTKPGESADAPLSRPVELLLKTIFPESKREKRPYKKRELSPEHRAKLVARGTQEHTCPHCGQTGRGPVMFKTHFGRCPKRLAPQPEVADVPS